MTGVRRKFFQIKKIYFGFFLIFSNYKIIIKVIILIIVDSQI